MVGKRVRKKKMRAPAVLLLLAAMSVLLTTVGPRGVAAELRRLHEEGAYPESLRG